MIVLCLLTLTATSDLFLRFFISKKQILALYEKRAKSKSSEQLKTNISIEINSAIQTNVGFWRYGIDIAYKTSQLEMADKRCARGTRIK